MIARRGRAELLKKTPNDILSFGRSAAKAQTKAFFQLHVVFKEEIH